MSTPRRVCLQVSGVKLKHEESVEASHPPVSSCISVYTSVLTLSNKLAVTFGSYGVYGVCLCAEQKLSHTSPPPTPPPAFLHRSTPSWGLPLCGLFLPFTSHSSLHVSVHCSIWQS